jgi:hypothetical protein
MAKILFVPFTSDEGGFNIYLNCMQWAEARPDVYIVSWYKELPDYPFKNAAAGDQIYIHGHCMADDADLHSPTGHTLGCMVVGDRLIECGLRPSFAGAIKVYGCETALETRFKSYARRLAIYLIQMKEFHQCRVYGYKGAVSEKYFHDAQPHQRGLVEGPDRSQGPHKWSVAQGKGIRRARDRRKLIDLD